MLICTYHQLKILKEDHLILWKDGRKFWKFDQLMETYIYNLPFLQIHRISEHKIWQWKATYRNIMSELYQLLKFNIHIPPERTINLSQSALSIEVPRNCVIFGRRAALYRMCQSSWSDHAEEQNLQWFGKFQVTRKYIFPIIVVMDPIHFNARGWYHWLHLQRHNTCWTGA